MYFDSPQCLWLLLALPPLAALMIWAWRAFRKFENSPKMGLFSYGSNRPSWFVRVLIGSLRILALATIVLAVAEPYIRIPSQEVKYENVRLFFLVDVSGSMQYAEDVKPNRLVAVRKETAEFLKQQNGSYETSVIPFAGHANAYYCPLTYSPSVYLPLIEKLGPDSAPTLGTDITAAFAALEQALKRDKLYDTGVNVVVLITDGGKEEADATNRHKLGNMVRDMSSKNCRINVVGVGGSEPCPLVRRDRKGNFVDYVRDSDTGAVAKSELDEEILKQLATAGKGNYLRFQEGNQLYKFLDDTLKENRVVGTGNIVYKKVTLQSYLFATAALLFWCCFLANRRK
jgi:Ca-activated chloride channel family protein